MYKVPDQLLRGLPQNPSQVTVHINMHLSLQPTIDSVSMKRNFELDLDIPVFYKNVDPVKGEQYSFVRIVPPAVANPKEKLLVFNNSQPKELSINVKSFTKGNAKVKLTAPAGWTINPTFVDVTMKGNEAEQLVKFTVTPPKDAQSADIKIAIEVNGKTYDRSSELISYDHIPEQLLLPKSEVKAIKLDVITSKGKIGYIAGAGDEIPDMLRQLGYTVEIISPNNSRPSTLRNTMPLFQAYEHITQ